MAQSGVRGADNLHSLALQELQSDDSSGKRAGIRDGVTMYRGIMAGGCFTFQFRFRRLF
jgi:hypothetical protein